jgi:hypothetical protein
MSFPTDLNRIIPMSPKRQCTITRRSEPPCQITAPLVPPTHRSRTRWRGIAAKWRPSAPALLSSALLPFPSGIPTPLILPSSAGATASPPRAETVTSPHAFRRLIRRLVHRPAAPSTSWPDRWTPEYAVEYMFKSSQIGVGRGWVCAEVPAPRARSCGSTGEGG